MNIMEFSDSNKMQNYATHSIFRYFGKLPPTLVSKLLDEYYKPNGFVLELMCGSGTTLVESFLRGIPAIGVDINPLSVILSQTKTTKIPHEVLFRISQSFQKYINTLPLAATTYFRPSTKNINYWFTNDAQSKLSAIKYFIDNEQYWIQGFNDESERRFLQIAFAAIIRKVSNASPRTGRIFHCKEDSTVDALQAMQLRINSNIDAIDSLPDPMYNYTVLTEDARKTSLSSNSFDFILNHPPYFALYKYSSDVLRFELEWLDFKRSQISKNEIEDGFKTTNALLLDNYIKDMADVFKEMHRLMKDDAFACVVVSDSKLREEQLPVVDRLIEAAQQMNLSLHKHYLRPVSFAQASYHRSANPNIRTNEDHILVFTK